MRTGYQKQLEGLHTELIRMAALCEDSIAAAIEGLLLEKQELRQKAIQQEKEIDLKEREIESICVRLLLREQPVASDLRQITAAQRMVNDLERIGDQAADIAAVAEAMSRTDMERGGRSFIKEASKSGILINDMAQAVTEMVSASVDSFVMGNLEKAREAIRMDDHVDELFKKVKRGLLEMIETERQYGGDCLDVLMIAKYLERIGDHAVNIAEWVIYSVTGERGEPA